MNTKVFIPIIVCLVIGGILAVTHLGGNTPIRNSTDYRNIPIGESFRVEPGIVMEKAFAPAYFEFRRVIPGATIDTWTGDGKINLGKEEIGYTSGDPLWILLYNGLGTPTTFSLQVINAPSDINHSDVTGGDYSKAPIGVLGGIILKSTLVTIEPKSCMKVPIEIHLPADIQYPDQWEFRILITNMEVPGQVSTAMEVRFFVYMRK